MIKLFFQLLLVVSASLRLQAKDGLHDLDICMSLTPLQRDKASAGSTSAFRSTELSVYTLPSPTGMPEGSQKPPAHDTIKYSDGNSLADIPPPPYGKTLADIPPPAGIPPFFMDFSTTLTAVTLEYVGPLGTASDMQTKSYARLAVCGKVEYGKGMIWTERSHEIKKKVCTFLVADLGVFCFVHVLMLYYEF